MELIIGGAYQGKLSSAVKTHGFKQDELFDLACGMPDRAYPCYYHLEESVKAAVKNGMDAEGFLELLLTYGKDAVIISREIGAGIVPMDPFERLYREIHGQVLRKLAERADTVVRVICGIEVRLK